MRYRLRTLLIVVTAISVILGAGLGVMRYINYQIIEAERDYWREQWRYEQGITSRPPNQYPGNLFTAKELSDLRADGEVAPVSQP
jgi:hypothetical protein